MISQSLQEPVYSTDIMADGSASSERVASYSGDIDSRQMWGT